MFMHRATRTHWGEVVDATIRELSTSALPIGRSASTSDHIAFNKGCLVHIGWKRVDATSSINDISKTNKPAVLSRNQTHTQRRQKNMMASPGTKPLPNVVKQTWCLLQEPSPYPTSSNKPDAFSKNQAPTQRRQTNLVPSPGTKPLPNVVKQTWCLLQVPNTFSTSSNLMPSPGTKPLPNVVKQTWCLLQEPRPYPTSSKKPAALPRNQTPAKGRSCSLHWLNYSYKHREHAQLLFSPGSSYFLLLTSCSLLGALFSLSLYIYICCSINVKDLVSHSYKTETQNVRACQAHLRYYMKSTLSDSTDSLHISLLTIHTHTHTHTHSSVAQKTRHKFGVANSDVLV